MSADRTSYWDLPPGSVIIGDVDRQPRVASQLLERLSVTDAPVEAQRDAVARWLGENEPSALLRHSLTRQGFMDTS